MEIKVLTLSLLTTTIVAPPSNASKWQMGFNSAFKRLTAKDWKIIKMDYTPRYRYITKHNTHKGKTLMPPCKIRNSSPSH